MDRRDPAREDSADALLRRLRTRIAAARAAGPGAPAPTGPAAADLEHAARFADVGTAVPVLAHLGSLRRAVAQITARGLLYFLRLVTDDQRRFNRLLLRAAAALDREAAAVRVRLSTLEAERGQQAARDSALEQRLQGVEAARAQLDARLRTLEAIAGAVTWAPAPAAAAAEPVDAWAFAQAFHGDEAAVRERQRCYVPYFSATHDVLDVGCGRGEFLELLRDAGVRGRGVDHSADMVLHCRAKGLDVVHAEALSYLAGLPDASVGGIFARQVLEHVPTAAVPAFVQLAYRKLRPDGVLAVETLNPECLLVHYRWFWMDLTHVRLIHPETLKFLLVSNGFRDLEGLFLAPRDEGPLIPPLALASEEPGALTRFNAATEHLNRLLHGSPDYALIARR